MNKLYITSLLIIRKFPKSIAGHTKRSRDPHAACVFETLIQAGNQGSKASLKKFCPPGKMWWTYV